MIWRWETIPPATLRALHDAQPGIPRALVAVMILMLSSLNNTLTIASRLEAIARLSNQGIATSSKNATSS